MQLLTLLQIVAVFSPFIGSGGADFAAWHDNLVARHKQKLNKNREKRQTACDSNAAFREYDGQCNNLKNPEWGANDRVYQRLLPPVYDDGIEDPRLKKANGDPLPSPRSISVLVHDFDRERPHGRGSVMLMEWGQFLAHDLTWTPMANVTENGGKCCYTDKLVTGGVQHSDVTNGGPCHPIIVTSDNDPYFNQNVSHRCKEFVRSKPVYDSDGVRQQKNMLSAYIDGQNVYGHDEDEMKALRENAGTGRKLITNNNNLPEDTSGSAAECVEPASPDYCMKAGDFRVNIYPGLGALHTIFVRYHNYLADELTSRHPDWDDETVFQNARKVVIAVLQIISFNEYLPMIIGQEAMTDYGLNSDWSYNASCDASIYNVFATAAFRFGHSMVPTDLLIDGVETETKDLLERPEYVLDSLDSVLSGIVTRSAERADRWYTTGMTNHLLENSHGEFMGTDIAAVNIQRGRDHGLPPYNRWRELCDGVESLTDISQMNADRRFQRAYGSDVNDVDLYSGALDERPQRSTVGPTYVCLLAKQFAKIRSCDRFWWESTHPTTGFSDALTDTRPPTSQMQELGRMKLSHVICLTTGITQIQERVLQVPDNNRNTVQSCETLLSRSMNLDLF